MQASPAMSPARFFPASYFCIRFQNNPFINIKQLHYYESSKTRSVLPLKRKERPPPRKVLFTIIINNLTLINYVTN